MANSSYGGPFGDLAPEEAPSDEFWAHWKRCRDCNGDDWAFLGYTDCVIAKRLLEELHARDRRVGVKDRRNG